MSLLGRSEILGLFVNTLTADDRYCRQTRESFPQPIQIKLYRKIKTFCVFLIPFLKLHKI